MTDKTIKELLEDAEQFEHYQDPKQVKRNKAKLARLNQKIQADLSHTPD